MQKINLRGKLTPRRVRRGLKGKRQKAIAPRRSQPFRLVDGLEADLDAPLDLARRAQREDAGTERGQVRPACALCWVRRTASLIVCCRAIQRARSPAQNAASGLAW